MAKEYGLVLLVPLAALWGPVAATSETSPPQIKATAFYPTWPLLVRNDHGPALRLELSVPEGTTTRLTAVRLALDGTTDLRDVAELTLFQASKEAPWAALQVLGQGRAGREVVLTCDYPLAAGLHHLWVSCRLSETASVGHQIHVACTALETTAGIVKPVRSGRTGPQRVAIALRRAGDDAVHTYRIPVLATTRNGTLLCVYDMRRRSSRDLQGDIDIGLSRSTDGGQTWEPVRVIVDMNQYDGLPEEQNGCSDPGLIVDLQTGTIFCFAVWMHGKPGKHQWTADGSEPGYEIGKTAQLLVVQSRDDGVSWSPPTNLTRQVKPESWWLLVHAPQQGIQLDDGTLVMPAQGRDETGRKFSTLLLSHDHGNSWQVATAADRDTSECQAALLSDGSIMLNMRNDREKFRAVAVTPDLGKTWRPHPTNRKTLIEPTCNASLLRVRYESQGATRHLLLFANPHSQQARSHQTIQVSYDDGMTWPSAYHLLLDEGRGFGYPSLTQIDSQHVGIVYEGSQAHLVFEKLPISQLIHPGK